MGKDRVGGPARPRLSAGRMVGSLKVACRTCGADVGQMCRGPLLLPHPARVDDAAARKVKA